MQTTFVGKPEVNRPLKRPRHGWEDNTTLDLREIAMKGVEWMHLDQDRAQ
jgi:hypothetical protein